MAPIKKVALLGKGLLGSAVLEELLKAGFDVTVLSRSVQETPAGPSVQVDYSSIESLTEALKGQDAVVSTITAAAALDQKILVEAAIAARVRRFIPSDFGSLSTDPSASGEPIMSLFAEMQNYLKEKAEAGQIEYTIIGTGPFLQYVFAAPVFLDFTNRSIEFHGKGDTRISTTSIAGIGKAIAGALANADQTKNRVLRVHEAVVTQLQLLEIAKRAVSDGSTWTETTVDAVKALETAKAKFFEDPTSMPSMLYLIKSQILSGLFHPEYTEPDNDLVGLPVLSDEELETQYGPLFGKSLH